MCLRHMRAFARVSQRSASVVGLTGFGFGDDAAEVFAGADGVLRADVVGGGGGTHGGSERGVGVVVKVGGGDALGFGEGGLGWGGRTASRRVRHESIVALSLRGRRMGGVL